MDYRIFFNGVQPSEVLENVIVEQVKHLQDQCAGAQSCRIVLSRPHARGRNGYVVHIEFHLRSGQKFSAYQDDFGAAHSDPYLAVHKAFKVINRMARNAVGKRRSRTQQEIEPMAQA